MSYSLSDLTSGDRTICVSSFQALSMHTPKAGAGQRAWENSRRAPWSILPTLGSVLSSCCLRALTEGCETCGSELSSWLSYGVLFQLPNLVKLHSSEISRYGCTVEASLNLTSEFFVVKDLLCCVAHTWRVSSRNVAPS